MQEDPSKKGGKVWKLKKPVRSQNVGNLLRFAHLSLSCARRQNSIGKLLVKTVMKISRLALRQK